MAPAQVSPSREKVMLALGRTSLFLPFGAMLVLFGKLAWPT